MDSFGGPCGLLIAKYGEAIHYLMAECPGIIDPSLEQFKDRIADMMTAPFIVHLGIELVSVTPTEVRMSMRLRPEFRNSNSVGHGGVIYTIADHAAAVAANVECDAVGQSGNITYHRPLVSDDVEAVSTRINSSRSLDVQDVRVYSSGKLIASGVFTAFKVRK